ncbi:hypothetical protein QQS21_002677 [Conoideocrella luteorostrata]|uniref:DNA-directed RNA polymerase II subunit RPB9-like zinc ribbon domain-containing protein n=1 Tax=Conoideocrella luteorostrata TaxID=1105319 RepID=A0AAJ0CUU4_9HYPO|nr:hypothetical protein QQS21_002677 [Conoideocrella luteorostrata]
MATPQSTASYEGSGPNKKLEQITFRFCSECSNMLYPKEDEDAHKLQFTCRTCQYTEEAQSTCVFRNVLNNSAGETAGVTQDVGSDPTVSEVPPVLCLGCGCLIFCDTCGDLATEVAVTEAVQSEKCHLESMGMCKFTLPWGEAEDPFDEYDEELPDEGCSGLASPTLTDLHSDTTDGTDFADDGAIIVAL